jgi:sugar lactone lactonase YvrE
MVYRVIGLAVAVSTLAACSGTGQLTAPTQPQSEPQSAARTSVDSVHADVRFGLDRTALARATAKRGPGSFPPRRQATLFVSDLDNNTVWLFPSKTVNPMPSGSITQGLDLPVNAAVDKNGTVYVANNGNSTVTEYPWGQTTPSVTLSTDIVNPNGVAVDSAGTVYVTSGASVGSCYVLEFPKGATTPSVTVNGFGLPIGLAFDKAGNLYVADAEFGNNHIWEVPKGTTTMNDLNLTGLEQSVGIAFNAANNLYVTNNESSIVNAYHLGQTTPFATITDDISGPYSIAFTKKGTLFVGNAGHNPGTVAGFHKGKTTAFENFSNGIGNPAGLAAFPR